ncbi:MAG: polymer-forming cytoskeletal protein, partial [Spirochaetales bacterium]|nr:polymer-forming cytoskeletal protein [Spirochaetales bacterium]
MKRNYFIIMVIMLMCSSLFSLEFNTPSHTADKESTLIEEDHLFFGKELNFTGKTKDLYFVGEKLVFDGSTSSGLTAFGKTLVINGIVENDCIAGGSTLEINGKIQGTVFAASGEGTLSGDSVIDGTLFIAGGNIKLQGIINGDVYAGSGVLTIDGTINGNVKAGAGEIIITEKGKVNGNFEYSTENKLNESEEQRITGKITYSESGFSKEMRKSEFAQFCSIFTVVVTIIGFISILTTGLLLLLLPCLKNFDYAGSHKKFWQYLLWGLIPFFIYPMAILVSMLLVITIPLGFILLLAALPLIFVTQILGITAFGQYLFRLFKWKCTNRFLYFLFGSVFFILASLIPIINMLG